MQKGREMIVLWLVNKAAWLMSIFLNQTIMAELQEWAHQSHALVV